jgi:argininosuccinate lyase
LTDLKRLSPLFREDFQQVPSVESAIATKAVPGGTAEESVRAAIRQFELKLKQMENKP